MMKKRMMKRELMRLRVENQRLSRSLTVVSLALTFANVILAMSRVKQSRRGKQSNEEKE